MIVAVIVAVVVAVIVIDRALPDCRPALHRLSFAASGVNPRTRNDWLATDLLARGYSPTDEVQLSHAGTENAALVRSGKVICDAYSKAVAKGVRI